MQAPPYQQRLSSLPLHKHIAAALAPPAGTTSAFEYAKSTLAGELAAARAALTPPSLVGASLGAGLQAAATLAGAAVGVAEGALVRVAALLPRVL